MHVRVSSGASACLVNIMSRAAKYHIITVDLTAAAKFRGGEHIEDIKIMFIIWTKLCICVAKLFVCNKCINIPHILFLILGGIFIQESSNNLLS